MTNDLRHLLTGTAEIALAKIGDDRTRFAVVIHGIEYALSYLGGPGFRDARTIHFGRGLRPGCSLVGGRGSRSGSVMMHG